MAMDPAKLDRTWLCTVLFMDIIGYSMNSDQIQARLKERFNRYVSEAIRDVAENDRVILDTGDGAAVCFLGAPESAMFTALKLRSSFLHDAEESGPSLKVRIGINLGPVMLVRDINDNLNAIGDGMNTGQRVMTFAAANQVLVSRSFFEVIICLADDYQQLFRYEGARQDKHVREHVVYQLVPPGHEGAAAAEPEPELAPEHVPAPPPVVARDGAVELSGSVKYGEAILASLRALLAPLVGPIAGHLVKRSAGYAPGAGALVRELASYISQPASRAKFLTQAGRLTGVTEEPAQQSSPSLAAAAAPPRVWDAGWLEKVREEMAAYVGPMARVLVDRTAKRVGSRKELCDVLSAELPAGKRERFKTALGFR